MISPICNLTTEEETTHWEVQIENESYLVSCPGYPDCPDQGTCLYKWMLDVISLICNLISEKETAHCGGQITNEGYLVSCPDYTDCPDQGTYLYKSV